MRNIKRILTAVLVLIPMKLYSASLLTQQDFTFGFWVPVASGEYVSVSSITFTGLASSTTYRIDFNLKLSNTATLLYALINDTYSLTNKYYYGGEVLGAYESAFVKYIPMFYNSDNAQGTNTTYTGFLEFGTVYGASTIVSWKGDAIFQYATDPLMTMTRGGGRSVTLKDTLSSIRIFPAAQNGGASTGNLTGWAYLYKRMQ